MKGFMLSGVNYPYGFVLNHPLAPVDPERGWRKYTSVFYYRDPKLAGLMEHSEDVRSGKLLSLELIEGTGGIPSPESLSYLVFDPVRITGVLPVPELTAVQRVTVAVKAALAVRSVVKDGVTDTWWMSDKVRCWTSTFTEWAYDANFGWWRYWAEDWVLNGNYGDTEARKALERSLVTWPAVITDSVRELGSRAGEYEIAVRARCLYHAIQAMIGAPWAAMSFEKYPEEASRIAAIVIGDAAVASGEKDFDLKVAGWLREMEGEK